MTKEQIKQILTDNFNTWGFTQEFFDLSADAILALPLEVPSDEEIKAWMRKDRDELIDHEVATAGEYMERRIGRNEGVIWAIDEIIKRNTIKP